MIRPTRFLVPATLLAAAAALTACTPTTATSEWSRPTLPDRIPAFTSASALPFDAYQLAESGFQRLQSAEAQLLSDCAAEYGAALTFRGDYTRPEDLSRVAWGGRFGTLDAAHASEFGYHASPESPWAPSGGFYLRDPGNLLPDDVVGSALSQVIMFGPEADPSLMPPTDAAGAQLPGGGCRSIVDGRLGGESASLVTLEGELINLSLEDERVQEAADGWSECMREQGYAYSSVQGAAEQYPLELLTLEETEVAAADVACTASSRWSDVFYAVLGAYQHQAVERRGPELEAVLAAQTDRLATASELVAGG